MLPFKSLLVLLLPLTVFSQFDIDICVECVKEAANGCTFCFKEDNDGNFVSVCSCDLEQVAVLGDCTDAEWYATTQRWLGCEMMENKRTTEGVLAALLVSVIVIFCIGLCVVLQFCYGCLTYGKKNKTRAGRFKSTNDLSIS